jgi:hypothetical protein
MATDDTSGSDSYLTNSSKYSRGDEAEDRAEQGSISEDGDTEESNFISTSTTRRANMASWAGQPSIKGSTEGVRMALLTLTAMGLQYAASYPIEIIRN